MIPIVTTPAILTDDIFVAYGGLTGTTTVAQRQAAYSIAEGQAIQEIGTFLESTIVTGTHSWPPMSQPLQLPYTHVSVISSVVAIHDAGCNCADDSVEIDGCAWLLDGDGGLVSLRECGNTLKASCSGCSCGHYGAGPLQVRVVYTAGLPANAANDPRLLMGLATAAQLALEQMTDPAAAEGGAGDPGIKSFSSLSYSETRADSSFKETAFGSSARANYAAKMLRPFKFKRALKLGW